MQNSAKIQCNAISEDGDFWTAQTINFWTLKNGCCSSTKFLNIGVCSSTVTALLYLGSYAAKNC
jgi:hypothetical protein